MNFKSYYARSEIQEAIYSMSTIWGRPTDPHVVYSGEIPVAFREIAWRYESGAFSQRPAQIHLPGDVYGLAMLGAVSFHVSVERWSDEFFSTDKPQDLSKFRKGWDFVFDLDASDFEVSKLVAVEIVNFLKRLGVRSVGIKFSGNKGWHIIIPYECFANAARDAPFPQAARRFAKYVMAQTHNAVVNATGIEDPWSVVEVDTIMLSARHLYRAPYSINEKTGLASVVIPAEKEAILSFEKSQAKPEKIENVLPFVQYHGEDISDKVKAIFRKDEDYTIIPKPQKIARATVSFKTSQTTPPCIQRILQGLNDGRKRALFILINFLRQRGKSPAEVEKIIREWNQRNQPPLRDAYINSQLAWHLKQEKPLLPPNCDRNEYYKDIGVCSPDSNCERIKNPVNYRERRE